MADLAAERARVQEAEVILRRLLAEEHPHLGHLASTARLVGEAGLSVAELDEIYFTALDTLGRRPPLDDSEVQALVNLNNPSIEELSRHIALNCPVMSPVEREAVLRPDPSVTTQGDAGLLMAEADHISGRDWGISGLLAVAAAGAIAVAIWLLLGD